MGQSPGNQNLFSYFVLARLSDNHWSRHSALILLFCSQVYTISTSSAHHDFFSWKQGRNPSECLPDTSHSPHTNSLILEKREFCGMWFKFHLLWSWIQKENLLSLHHLVCLLFFLPNPFFPFNYFLKIVHALPTSFLSFCIKTL